MAHFSVYDTDVTTSATGGNDQNNGANPFPAVKGNEELKLQPLQTDFAEFVSGSVESEKAGTLFVEQSFDYPRDHENETEALAKAHWVPVETGKEGEKLEKGFTVAAKTPLTFVVFAGAPYVRLRWKQNAEENKSLRLFARAQEKGRV